ncbi:hypothetical protein B566_EDAN016483 [Ephemera danica]|nr:hypothetical protein B566_EDAN016483 [Ephemera danica]
MRLIFSTEVLLRMNYAGHSVYVENGPRKPQNIEKSETGSSEQVQHLFDNSEPSVGCFEEVSINPEPTDEVLNTNAEEIPEVAAEEVLNSPEPMEQVLENSEQIQTENSEQVSNSNGEKSLKNPDNGEGCCALSSITDTPLQSGIQENHAPHFQH